MPRPSRTAFGALLLALAAPPALAQARPGGPPAGGVRSTPSGFMLDFDDQDLRVVLTALAAAAGANVTFGPLPAQRITLRIGTPVPRDSLVGMLRAVAETNGLRVSEGGGLLRIEGPPSPASAAATAAFQRAQQQGQQPPQLQLFSYRLRHANAQELAQVLTAIFAGTPVNRGGITVTGPGGVQVFTPGVPAQPVRPVPQGGNNAAAAQLPPQTLTTAQTAAALQQFAAQQLAALSPSAGDIRVVAEVSTNSLIVRATAQDWGLIQGIVQAVDLRPLQVLIEVTIAEVTRTSGFRLGVSGTGTHVGAGRNPVTTGVTTNNPRVTDRDLVVRLTGGGGAIDFDVAISALAERGEVRVLSLPIIIAQNNKQAVLNVGTQRPFVQVTQTVPNDPTGRVQTVQYINVGTTLTITPIINPDGYVNLMVDQTDDAATAEVQFDAPVISKRQATTQVFLRDGQTTVVGGLAGRQRTRSASGVPVLSRIPVLGALFGGQTRDDETTELFVFLTPHIVSGDADIDRLREAVKDGTVLLKQQNLEPMIRTPADTIPADSLRVPADSVRRPPAGRVPDDMASAASAGVVVGEGRAVTSEASLAGARERLRRGGTEKSGIHHGGTEDTEERAVEQRVVPARVPPLRVLRASVVRSSSCSPPCLRVSAPPSAALRSGKGLTA